MFRVHGGAPKSWGGPVICEGGVPIILKGPQGPGRGIQGGVPRIQMGPQYLGGGEGVCVVQGGPKGPGGVPKFEGGVPKILVRG